MKKQTRPFTKKNVAIFNDNFSDLKAEARSSEKHDGRYTSLLNEILDKRYAKKRNSEKHINVAKTIVGEK